VFGLESLATSKTVPGELEELARRRLKARWQRDYDEADRLREEIERAGWQVRDVEAEPGFQLVPQR
jgi:cysteinyl-tRNA synthetase